MTKNKKSKACDKERLFQEVAFFEHFVRKDCKRLCSVSPVQFACPINKAEEQVFDRMGSGEKKWGIWPKSCRKSQSQLFGA
jgi:hypothetical protein